MKSTLKRLLGLALAAVMLFSAVPTQTLTVTANPEPVVRLPEVALGEDVLGYDMFYLASATAEVQEGESSVYLLRVGRGGPADSASTALVKIADMTAKYGRDYIIRIHDTEIEAENPEDNLSLLEMLEGSDFEQGKLGSEDELEALLEEDPEAQEALQEGVDAAVDYLGEESGLNDKYAEGDPYAEAVSEAYGDALTVTPDGERLVLGGAEKAIDPLQAAANLFTGQNATAQRLTSEGDLFQDLQAIANVMTEVVAGASVELRFAPGETEKYLEIVPLDNTEGDGDRTFYVILGAPSGSTTNSAASTCAVTILDDEEQAPAAVSFSEAVYVHDPDEDHVTVTVERSGAMNTVVSVQVKTTGTGTAQAGRDYSEVDCELVFPFGVDHLTLDIPVRTTYLSGEGSFGLGLEPVAGCELGETAEAAVSLDGSYSACDGDNAFLFKLHIQLPNDLVSIGS